MAWGIHHSDLGGIVANIVLNYTTLMELPNCTVPGSAEVLKHELLIIDMVNCI